MKTSKLWRQSRFSEKRANLFVTRRMRALCAVAFGHWQSRPTLLRAVPPFLSLGSIGAMTVLAVMLSLVSCSSDDEQRQDYQPAHRSAIFNRVKLVLTDADGNDLGGQTETLSTLRIYGNLSKQYVTTERAVDDGVTYIKFNADLPDERDLSYSDDKRSGKGTSTMTISVGRKVAHLTFAFEATDSGEQLLGGNGIRIVGVQLGSKVVANEEGGDMVVVLIVGDDGLTLATDVPIPEEEATTSLVAVAPLGD